MRLFEYQGKILFKNVGINIPNNVLIDFNSDSSSWKTFLYPAIAKVQTLAPGRGEHGGVQVCENFEDLLFFVNKYLGRNFGDEIVNRIMLEEMITFENEFYIALKINSLLRCIDLIFSNKGGNGLEKRVKTDSNTIKVIHLDPLKPLLVFNANNIAKELGFSGKTMIEVSNLIFKLYELFNKFDSKLIEINPVVLTSENHIYALDAIVQIDDDANFRLSFDNNIGLISEERPREPTTRELKAMNIDQEDYRGAVHYIDLDEYGDIGLLSVGSGFSITVMDILKNFGVTPANFCDCSGNPSKEKVAKAAKLIMSIPGIKAFLFISGMVSQPLNTSAEGIVMAFNELAPEFPIFVRMAGNQDVEAVEILKSNGITNSYSREVSVEEIILKVKSSL